MNAVGGLVSRSKGDINAISQKYQNIDNSFDDALRKGERLKRKIRHMKYSRR